LDWMMSAQWPEGSWSSAASCWTYWPMGKTCHANRVSLSGVVRLNGVT
jgi:hypothetical protein